MPGNRKTVSVTSGAGKDEWMFADERPGKQGPEIDAVSGATPSGDVHLLLYQVFDAKNYYAAKRVPLGCKQLMPCN